MPTRFVHLAVDSAEPALIGRFWADLLGWPVTFEDADETYIQGPAMGMAFVPVPEPKTVPNRVRVDLAGSSPEHREELVTRAIDLGAHRTDTGLADPEGNEFRILGPRPDRTAPGPLAVIILDAADPAAIAPFWSAATGWPVLEHAGDVITLGPATGPVLRLSRATEPKRAKNRIHLDLAPFAGEDHAGEVSRLIGLGARHADVGQGEVPWTVLADPQGNEFCVLTPRGQADP